MFSCKLIHLEKNFGGIIMFSDAILLNYQLSGECEIDVERIKQEWHEGAAIHCHENYDSKLDLYIPNFQLIENSSDCKGRIKITINKCDAIKIIHDLELIPQRGFLFTHDIIYRK